MSTLKTVPLHEIGSVPVEMNLTSGQEEAAASYHNSEGVEGTLRLYRLYLTAQARLCEAQREIARLKGWAHE